MNKQKKEFIHIGFSSILMVFTMLCLVTFATLSLITANSDYRLSPFEEQFHAPSVAV